MRRLDPAAAADVMRQAGLEPLVPYPGAAASWPSRCMNCGQTSTTSLCKIKGGRGPCKWCARNGPVSPEEAREVALGRQLEPLEPYPGKNTAKWRCRCLVCGSEVTPRYSNIQSGGSRGCQTCKAATLRSLRLSETPVEQAIQEMRNAGLEPLVPFPGTNPLWLSRCMKCGKESSPALVYIRKPGRGTGCKWCASNAPVDPEAALSFMLAAGLEPRAPFPGSNIPWRCQCRGCGTAVSPTYSTVRAGGGCRACAPRGFDPSKPAFVYLVAHEGFHAVKVGIGNVSADRLDRHRKNGWTVLAVVHMAGERAPEVERAILNWWRKDLGLPKYLSAAEMPNRGWTETAEADEVDIPATITRIRELAACSVGTDEVA